MAKRTLTAGGIVKMKGGAKRLEIHDAGAQGLHLLIQTSGHKSFALRFRRPGGARAKVTLGPFNPDEPMGEPVIGGPLTLAQARSLAARLNLERAGGADIFAQQRVARHRKRAEFEEAKSFGAAVKLFTENHRVKKTGERPRRWKETQSLLNTLPWADRPLSSITSDDIFTAIEDAKRGRRGKRSESAGRHMGSALAVMFGWLHRNRRITTNPCIGIYKPPAPPSRDRVLSDAEVKLLWQACDRLGATTGTNSQPPWGALIKLLLLTGCRLREIARLEDDELTADMICLPANRTKNGLPHDVPLSALARDVLAGVQRMPNCRFVFSTNGKTPVSGFSKMKRKLDEQMVLASGGPIVPFRLHDLRRVASTGMSELGVLPHIVEACINHISGAAKGGVAGVYNKAKYNPEKRVALQQWADHVAGIVS